MLYSTQLDHNRQSVYKTRRCFLWKNQYFQLDIYNEPCHPRCVGFIRLTRVVRKVDNAIHWINHYPVDTCSVFLLTDIHWIVIYPVGSVIQPLHNWGQDGSLRDTVSFATMLTWTPVFSLWQFTPTWNQSASRILLQSSQCFALLSIVYWKTCFWVCFCPSYNVVFIIFGLKQ